MNANEAPTWRACSCASAQNHALQVARPQSEYLAAHIHLVPPIGLQPADSDALAVQLRAGLKPCDDGSASGETLAGGAAIFGLGGGK